MLPGDKDVAVPEQVQGALVVVAALFAWLISRGCMS